MTAFHSMHNVEKKEENTENFFISGMREETLCARDSE